MTDNDALRFDPDTYDAACELAKSAPLDLNEWHFDQLSIISKSLETDAREAQKQAQLAIVHARTVPPVQTKAAAPAAPKKRTTLTQADCDMIEEGIGAALIPIFQNHKAKLAALEQRIATIEAKPTVKFCGTWERGKTYEPGHAVVRDGGLWICKAQTPGEPSKDFVGWQLAVKRGSV